MSDPQVKAAIVVGASGGIAQTLIGKLLQTDSDRHVIAISRSKQDTQAITASDSRLHWRQSNNTEESMGQIAAEIGSEPYCIDRLFICNGILHQGRIKPEKRLKSVTYESLDAVFKANAFIPILWLKHLLPTLSPDGDNVVTVFSARVGSIDDNRAGGWYAYRASKAALNMLIKTAAIEYRRFAKNTRFLLFHPGTTETALSAPYRSGVSPDKLFTPSFVADRLLHLVEALPADSILNFLDWDGKEVAW